MDNLIHCLKWDANNHQQKKRDTHTGITTGRLENQAQLKYNLRIKFNRAYKIIQKLTDRTVILGKDKKESEEKCVLNYSTGLS